MCACHWHMNFTHNVFIIHNLAIFLDLVLKSLPQSSACNLLAAALLLSILQYSLASYSYLLEQL